MFDGLTLVGFFAFIFFLFGMIREQGIMFVFSFIMFTYTAITAITYEVFPFAYISVAFALISMVLLYISVFMEMWF